MHFTKNRGFRLKVIDKIGISYFIALIGFASIGSIWAIYLKSFLGNNSYVGFLSSIFTVISFLSYLFIIPIVEKYSKTKLLFLALFMYFFSYLIFSVYSNIYLIIILGFILAIVASLRVTLFGIIVRDKTRDSVVSKNEGLIFSFLNAAWFIGPIFGGYIAGKFGFNYVFLFAALVILISLLMFTYFGVKDNRTDKKIDYNTLKVIIEFFKKKERVLSYFINSGTNFWWALIYIYMPIYIIEHGFSNFIVGFFISAAVVPLILCEYHFGKVAGRKGFKRLFFKGHFIMGSIAVLCFIYPNIYFVIPLMILASFGAAMVEPTTDAYFFDVIKKNERDKFYGPFTTSIDTGHLVANLLAAIVLLILPFRFVFLFFGIVMFMISCCSLKIKDHLEVKNGRKF